MKQTLEQRREHHQTKEDRQRKAYEQLAERVRDIHAGRYYGNSKNLPVYVREMAYLAQKIAVE